MSYEKQKALEEQRAREYEEKQRQKEERKQERKQRRLSSKTHSSLENEESIPKQPSWLTSFLGTVIITSMIVLLPIYACIAFQGIKFTVLPDYIGAGCLQTFLARAFFCGVISNSAFLATSKRKIPVTVFMISAGSIVIYLFLEISIFHKLFTPLVWAATWIYVAFGAIPALITVVFGSSASIVKIILMILASLIFGGIIGHLSNNIKNEKS